MKKKSVKNYLLKDIKVSTIYSGIKKTQDNEDDLLLIELEKKSTIAGVFTQSLTSSASVNQCKKNLTKYKEPIARAILVNSGNANAFTGKLGEETVLKISKSGEETVVETYFPLVSDDITMSIKDKSLPDLDNSYIYEEL